ncbi:hypothetical protein SAMN05421760_104165 [Neptunomonas antarctica]|uniref:Uncharacterized protein n=1 Tax=Neptunomonas antarctica TaxID=619304 RepID=A0A1N7LMM0_9GAMM|nr:hypothetical protein SAMN05421760_104165 [Neptunomonas antarctica]
MVSSMDVKCRNSGGAQDYRRFNSTINAKMPAKSGGLRG